MQCARDNSMNSDNNFNYIRVRSFILSGAPSGPISLDETAGDLDANREPDCNLISCALYSMLASKLATAFKGQLGSRRTPAREPEHHRLSRPTRRVVSARWG